jgi:hypothetical protein
MVYAVNPPSKDKFEAFLEKANQTSYSDYTPSYSDYTTTPSYSDYEPYYTPTYTYADKH